MATSDFVLGVGSVQLLNDAGTPAAGVQFGTAQDANIYRTGAAAVRTDGSFYVGAGLTVVGTATMAAATHSGLLTANLGLTVIGAAVNLNANSNFAINIGATSNNTTIDIGSASLGAMTVRTGSTLSMTVTSASTWTWTAGVTVTSAGTNNLLVISKTAVSGTAPASFDSTSTITAALTAAYNANQSKVSVTGSGSIAFAFATTGHNFIAEYTGTDTAGTAIPMLRAIRAGLQYNSSATATITETAGMYIEVPVFGGTPALTVTAAYGLYVSNQSARGTAGVTFTSSYGIYVGTQGVVGGYGLFSAGGIHYMMNAAIGDTTLIVDSISGQTAAIQKWNVNGVTVASVTAAGAGSFTSVALTGGMTVTGGVINLNTNSNFAVNIASTSNTTSVAIGNASLVGAFTITTGAGLAITSATASTWAATGGITISAGTLTISTAGTGLAVTNNMTVGGTLGITGTTTSAAVTASGLVTANAGLTVVGQSNLKNNAVGQITLIVDAVTSTSAHLQDWRVNGGVLAFVDSAGYFHTPVHTETSGSVAPTTGTWAHNDICWNNNTAAFSYIGWVCVTAGTPGTWKEFGPIAG